MPNTPSFPLTFQAPDYLDRFASEGHIDQAAIRSLREERDARLWAPNVQKYRDAVQAMQQIQAVSSDCSGAEIRVEGPSDLNVTQQVAIERALRSFCPWKKGPFSLLGHTIDAEWRSDWKWERIEPHVKSLKDKRIADIGCHNGYFMFRMAEQNPACVVGFEPFAKHYWNFQLIQQWIQNEALAFELLGVEHVHHFRGFFDTIFCLGILYHHTDPVGLLRKLHQALASKGEIIIDCQGIPGAEPVALTPRRRYAQARGIWFLPTQSCLEHWMLRAGFANVECFFAEPLSVQEQRRTEWADVDSLREFLDPNDPTQTLEGYPAPWRFYVRATKS